MSRFFAASLRASVVPIMAGLLFLAGCADVITYSKQSREKGLENYAKADYGDAAGDFRNAIRQQPADYRSHYYLGSCYEHDKAYHQAIQQYKTCLAIMPTSLEGQADKPFRLKAINSLASAIALTGDRSTETAALAQSARTAEDYFLIAKVDRNLGDADAALLAYHQAALLDPKDFDIAKDYALYLVKLQQVQQADPELRRAYAMNDHDPEVNEGLRQIGIIPGPSLKPENDLAKPIIPEGPIPNVDLTKVRLQNPFKTEDSASSPTAQTDPAPKD